MEKNITSEAKVQEAVHRVQKIRKGISFEAELLRLLDDYDRTYDA